MDGAIAAKRVTYDFARLMDGATELKTSEFGDAMINICDTRTREARETREEGSLRSAILR
jgi:hypothetical protein